MYSKASALPAMADTANMSWASVLTLLYRGNQVCWLMMHSTWG